MNVELRARSFGELVGLSFQLPVTHFGKLFVIFVVLGVPAFGADVAFVFIEETQPGEVVGSAAIIIAFLQSLLACFQQAAAVLAVSGSFTGHHVPLGTCLRESLRRFPGLVMFFIVINLLVSVTLCTIIVPLLLTVWFFVVVPAMMIERVSWTEAMGRSRELTAGHRWSVFCFLVLALFILFGVLVPVVVLTETVLPGIPGAVVTSVAQVIAAMPLNIGAVVYYFHLRVVKESFDVDQLSALVDAIAARGEAAIGEADGGAADA